MIIFMILKQTRKSTKMEFNLTISILLVLKSLINYPGAGYPLIILFCLETLHPAVTYFCVCVFLFLPFQVKKGLGLILTKGTPQ